MVPMVAVIPTTVGVVEVEVMTGHVVAHGPAQMLVPESATWFMK